jgi:hypothetical protein
MCILNLASQGLMLVSCDRFHTEFWTNLMNKFKAGIFWKRHFWICPASLRRKDSGKLLHDFRWIIMKARLAAFPSPVCNEWFHWPPSDLVASDGIMLGCRFIGSIWTELAERWDTGVESAWFRRCVTWIQQSWHAVVMRGRPDLGRSVTSFRSLSSHQCWNGVSVTLKVCCKLALTHSGLQHSDSLMTVS